MSSNLFARVFGSRNQRMVAKMQRTVDAINALEEGRQAMSDEQLRASTQALKDRHTAGEDLESLIPEAFANVREAGRRVLNMRHFDVQMIGGLTLHGGQIAEMRTGEGKTLVATLPSYLNALSGKGVHVVTVNDYLAKRDAEWMGQLFEFLGLSVGVVVQGQSTEEKRAAYAADITYGTNNEFGFDYLRDNMAFSAEEKVQRGLNFAVVDEVDSILVDEARTPLIISGPTDDDPELYRKINSLPSQLEAQVEENGPGDFSIEEKGKQIHLTDEGHEKVEALMQEAGLIAEGESLYDSGHIVLMHHLNAALRAHSLYNKNVEYIVRDRQVVIVDEFTGRTMPGRRWSDGLHQAIEAKEGVPIQQENQTLASITFQNYFRLYNNLSGMTGTADTEAFEFQQIYSLEVVVIPTNKPMVREDLPDQVFMTAPEKFNAIASDITEAQERGQPVLVGTASIETSEYLSELLKKSNIQHEVLNAKQHEREADIIVHAGRPGSVTIATNMAGRGTDIVLGGNLEAELAAAEGKSEAEIEKIRQEWSERHKAVLEAGGLYVVGSERHESRRIDNQLRGRSGRQGDPGRTRFYLSLDDNLMRIFTPPRMKGMLQKLGMQEGEVIEHKWVTRSIETAQRKVESHNFDIRKNLLEYDNVANDQRRVIYGQRDELMSSGSVSEVIDTIRGDVASAVLQAYVPPDSHEELWDIPGLTEVLGAEFGLTLPVEQWLKDDAGLGEAGLRLKIHQALDAAYAEKREQVGADLLSQFEKSIMLQVLDNLWREHLAAMDYLRKGIHLRGYAQKDPKNEYKREAFQMFNEMLERMKYEVVSVLARVQVQEQADVDRAEEERRLASEKRSMEFEHADHADSEEAAPAPPAGQPPRQQGGGAMRRRPAAPPRPETFVREGEKVGRNEPCPCGSGKKYKQCHGKLA